MRVNQAQTNDATLSCGFSSGYWTFEVDCTNESEKCQPRRIEESLEVDCDCETASEASGLKKQLDLVL